MLIFLSISAFLALKELFWSKNISANRSWFILFLSVLTKGLVVYFSFEKKGLGLGVFFVLSTRYEEKSLPHKCLTLSRFQACPCVSAAWESNSGWFSIIDSWDFSPLTFKACPQGSKWQLKIIEKRSAFDTFINTVDTICKILNSLLITLFYNLTNKIYFCVVKWSRDGLCRGANHRGIALPSENILRREETFSLLFCV